MVGGSGRRGIKGRKKNGITNSIISKIYFKKVIIFYFINEYVDSD